MIVALGLLTVWWLSARGSSTRQVLAVAIIVTIAATAFQRWTYPTPALPDWGLPTSVQTLKEPLNGAQGDTLVVGTKEIPELTSMWAESSLANAWFVNPSTVQNGYQIISFVRTASCSAPTTWGSTVQMHSTPCSTLCQARGSPGWTPLE